MMTLCTKCKKCTSAPGRKWCEFCLSRASRYDKKHYYKNHQKQLLRLKQKRERYKKEGRCPKCGCPAELMFKENIQCMNCTQELHVPQGTPQYGGLLLLDTEEIYENHNTQGPQ